MRDVLLFDLDETLVVEEPAAVAAFEASARLAAESHEVDVDALAIAARSRARELWYASPTHPYCRRIGISSWEGLWCRFEADEPDTRRLREWSPRYRRDAWALALADQGVRDQALAEELGEWFATERRARHETFDDAAPVLTELGENHTLALVTNGASCLQREKLAQSGLGRHFAAVVVSGDIGVGKPDERIFTHALSLLDGGAGDAVMVGDSLSRDVEGALAAGLHAVWLNRSGRARPDGAPDFPEIATLGDLRVALGELPSAPSAQR